MKMSRLAPLAALLLFSVACAGGGEKAPAPSTASEPPTTTTVPPTTTTVPPTTKTVAVPKTPHELNTALMTYCVNAAKALYKRRPDIGKDKDPVARCAKQIDDGTFVDRAGVNAEIAYTEAYYGPAPAAKSSTTVVPSIPLALPTTTTTTITPISTCEIRYSKDGVLEGGSGVPPESVGASFVGLTVPDCKAKGRAWAEGYPEYNWVSWNYYLPGPTCDPGGRGCYQGSSVRYNGRYSY